MKNLMGLRKSSTRSLAACGALSAAALLLSTVPAPAQTGAMQTGAMQNGNMPSAPCHPMQGQGGMGMMGGGMMGGGMMGGGMMGGGMMGGGMMGGMMHGQGGMMGGGMGHGMMGGGGMGMMGGRGMMGRMGGGMMNGRGMNGQGGGMGSGMGGMGGGMMGGHMGGGMGMMGGGMMGGGMQDMGTIHSLLADHNAVTREVRPLPNGVDTLTESDDPRVAALLQEHVPAMYTRMKTDRPIRQGDPLFAELYRNARKIHADVTFTPRGVRVIATSTDPYVVRLIQAHARAVDGFVERGMAAMHEMHAVPTEGDAAPAQGNPHSGHGTDAAPPVR